MKLKLRKIEERRFYLWTLLGIVGLILFIWGPIIVSFFLSFNDWSIVETPRWVGGGNYAELLKDEYFWQSLKVTTLFTAMTLPAQLIAGLSWALLLNRAIIGRAVFRTIFYLPCVTSGVAIAILWGVVLDPDVGVANEVLRWIHLPSLDWISSLKLVIPSFTLIYVWLAGSNMLIYLSGLQSIPNQLYEAATLDGAGTWKKFWLITLPMLTPVILFTLVVGIISCFKAFAIPYVLTQGGPGNASLFYVMYLYRQAFVKFRMGYASALGWILLIVTFTITLIVFKTSKRWVYYEAQ